MARLECGECNAVYGECSSCGKKGWGHVHWLGELFCDTCTCGKCAGYLSHHADHCEQGGECKAEQPCA